MTPNLKRLFEEARADIPTDCAGSEYNLMARKRDLADHAVRRILWDHGEALIAALEELVNINEGSFGGESERWEQLLAQIEAEAQP